MLGGLAGLVGLSAVAGVLVTATVTPAIALSGAAASSAIEMFDNLPSVLDIDQLMLPTTLYAKNQDTGEYVELTQFYDQNRSPVEFDEISPLMYDAILSSEDPRYYQHGGVDLIGTTRAILSNVQGGGETQGGSSISQQYVKNILVQKCEADAKATEVENEDGEVVTLTKEEVLANCWTDATTAVGTEGIQRKLQEMRYAIALEQKYSKNEILLGYLNIANFGGTTYGIDAAARYYFGVTAANLTLSQAATLAGIVQNPNTYRIDKVGGSILDADGVGYNKAPDGLVDDVSEGTLAGLDSLLADGTITQEQYLAAADGYSATKGRQLYVLSRLLDDGKITQEQYVAAVIEPITPKITAPKTGCAAALGAEYFCQYVRYVVERDPAFGETPEERTETLRRGGLNIYTTLDWRVQKVAQSTISAVAPTSVPGTKFGAAGVSVEATTGRVLAIAQNTKFSETITGDNNYSSIVFAGNNQFGNSNGFNAGSTFKLFTLIDWLEQGNSVNEVLNGADRPLKSFPAECLGGTWNGTYQPGNFGRTGGRVGTPMQFTASSLNTGYLAMAQKLDLCDIIDVADKMGVTTGREGADVKIPVVGPNQVIGSDNVSPLAMAGAYATVANNGIYCQPTAIDKVTDADGNELPLPERACSQVLDPKVAATAAYALQGVMNSGGTGAQGNPFDGTPLIGKTGTHQELQTWLIESSTKVTTAAWVGNAEGNGDVFKMWHNGRQLSQLRYIIAEDIQREADRWYKGTAFAAPDGNLTRRVLTDLPNVVGRTVGEATKILEDAGFEVILGAPVDSPEATDIIVAQNPPAGKTAGGTPITISPSNGQGLVIPDVTGERFERAREALNQAGFGNIRTGSCTQDDDPENDMRATGTTPAGGTVANRNARIWINFTALDCG